jgi:hypothetical protein
MRTKLVDAARPAEGEKEAESLSISLMPFRMLVYSTADDAVEPLVRRLSELGLKATLVRRSICG